MMLKVPTMYSELKNEGTVKGYSYVGGVIGCNASGQIIVDAINNGNISGLDRCGGNFRILLL